MVDGQVRVEGLEPPIPCSQSRWPSRWPTPSWYSRRGSNSHARRHRFLRPAGLPIPPREHACSRWESNPHTRRHRDLNPARMPFRHESIGAQARCPRPARLPPPCPAKESNLAPRIKSPEHHRNACGAECAGQDSNLHVPKEPGLQPGGPTSCPTDACAAALASRSSPSGSPRLAGDRSHSGPMPA